MNKEIFIRDLRNFLSDLPKEELEQAIAYYEDYFEDAGVENEQKVIEELGAPIDIAKQIKMVNHENIEYGHGNTFHSSNDCPQVYSENTQNKGYTGNNTYNQQQANGNFAQSKPEKESWTKNPLKVTVVILLAILAIPVGCPLIISVLSLVFSILVTLFTLLFAYFITAVALAVSGLLSIVAGFATIPVSGASSMLFLVGIGLILLSVGIFLFWFGTFFCRKFFPAFFSLCGRICSSIGKGFRSFFS